MFPGVHEKFHVCCTLQGLCLLEQVRHANQDFLHLHGSPAHAVRVSIAHCSMHCIVLTDTHLASVLNVQTVQEKAQDNTPIDSHCAEAGVL